MAFKGNKPRQENFIFVTKNGAKKRVQKPLVQNPIFKQVRLLSTWRFRNESLLTKPGFTDRIKSTVFTFLPVLVK